MPIFPPVDLPGFPDAKAAKRKTAFAGGLRARWKNDSGTIYEWDYQHGHVEVYNRRGRHRGAYDVNSGQKLSEADNTRHVQP